MLYVNNHWSLCQRFVNYRESSAFVVLIRALKKGRVPHGPSTFSELNCRVLIFFVSVQNVVSARLYRMINSTRNHIRRVYNIQLVTGGRDIIYASV